MLTTRATDWSIAFVVVEMYVSISSIHLSVVRDITRAWKRMVDHMESICMAK